MNEFKAVKEFMLACGQEVPKTPRVPSDEVLALRIELIEEEVTELLKTLYFLKENVRPLPESEKLRLLVRVADDVADVNYVVNGTAAAFGIDGEATFALVHRANMNKLTGPKSPSGKQLKPEGWQPPEPQITRLIEAQRRDFIPSDTDNVAGVPWEGPQNES